MKNIFFAFLIISAIFSISSCNKTCKGEDQYFPEASSLKEFSFKPGSYWVYQDSISGIIDSQVVYYYTAHNNVVIGYNWGSNGVEDCPVSSDTFSMAVTSFWNGIPHDTILFDNGYSGNYINITESSNPHSIFEYAIDGSHTETLNNFTVSGNVYPTAYLSVLQASPQIYIIDNVGVVKWVFNDTINGQHTWNLLRYHVINP